jgi:hypothetical protein
MAFARKRAVNRRQREYEERCNIVLAMRRAGKDIRQIRTELQLSGPDRVRQMLARAERLEREAQPNAERGTRSAE